MPALRYFAKTPSIRCFEGVKHIPPVFDCWGPWYRSKPLQWRHNGRDGVSNHWRLDCLLTRWFRRWSKKTSKLSVIDLCEGNPHKGPVTRKMFPFDDVIMLCSDQGLRKLWRGQNFRSRYVPHKSHKICVPFIYFYTYRNKNISEDNLSDSDNQKLNRNWFGIIDGNICWCRFL